MDQIASLRKKGLEPDEFQKLLESKMKKLFKRKPTDKLESIVRKSIEKVTQTCDIRETKSGQRDQRRRRANREMQVEGLLDDGVASPGSIQRQTRRPGDFNPQKRANSGYHKQQKLIFLELHKQNKLESKYLNLNSDPCTTEDFLELQNQNILDSNFGQLLNGNNGLEATTEEACNILDGITLEYIEEYEYISKSKSGPSKKAQGLETPREERQFLRNIFDLCKSIVIGRVYVDWAVENDIMEHGGYGNWKSHVWMLMSFAALLVIIDVLSKTPKYGSNSLLEEGS